MKKLFLYILLLFCFAKSFSQPIVNRANSVSTVQDARLSASLNLFMPKYADTTAANLNKGIDTCGAIIYTYLGNRVWVRGCSPKQWVSVGSRFGYPTEDVLADGNRRFDFAGYKMYLDSGSLILNAEVFPTSDTAFAVKKGIIDLIRVSGTDGITYINSISSQTFSTYQNFANFSGGYVQHSGNVINLAYQQPFYITRAYPNIAPAYGVVIDNDTTSAFGIDSNLYYPLRINYTSHNDNIPRNKFWVSGAGTIYAANYPHSGDQDSMLVVFNGQVGYRSFVEIQAAIGGGSGGGTLANVGSGYWAAVTGTTNVKTFLAGPAQIIDSATANSLRFSVDTNAFYPRLWNPSGYITDTNLHLSYLYPLYAADDTTLAIDTGQGRPSPRTWVATAHYVDSLVGSGSPILGGNSGVNKVGTNIQLGQSPLLKHTSLSGNRLFNLTVDSSNFIVRGTVGQGQTIPAYSQAQMFFYPRKGAFRAGRDFSGIWVDANIGNYSAAFNAGTTASGESSFSIGQSTVASEISTFAGGSNSTASAPYAFAYGEATTTASGESSVTFGPNFSKSKYGMSFGAGLYSKSWGGVVVGTNNDSTNSASLTTFDVLNRAFQVGIGSSNSSRANAMTVLFSGNVGIGTVTPVKILHTVGTVRHVSLGTITFDTTLRKPLTIDASGDIASGFWAGGVAGGNTIYTGDGSLAGNRTVTLAGFTFNFEGPSGGSFLSIDPGAGGESASLASINQTAGGNTGNVSLSTTNIAANARMESVFNAGAKTASFVSFASSTRSNLTLTSDSIYLASTLSGSAVGYVWTLINPITGSGRWATGARGIDDVLAVGQALTTTRTVTVGTNNLTFTGSASSGNGLINISTSGSSSGLYIESTSTGNGLDIISTGGGYGVSSFAVESVSTISNSRYANTSAQREVLRVIRETSGTAASGIGAKINMAVETDGGSALTSNELISLWSDAANATRTSQFIITGVNSAVTEYYAYFQTGGIVIVNNLADTLSTKAYARSVGGGGGSSLFPTTGTGTATGNVVGSLAGFNLSIQESGNNLLNFSNAGLVTQLIATDASAVSDLRLEGDTGNDVFFRLTADDGTNSVQIKGDAIAEAITLTSDSIYLTATLSGTAVGYVWTLVNPTNGSGKWAVASGAVTWNAIAAPTGDLALTFDAGESTTFTNSNTTEDFLTINSSTITTSSFLSLNSTSTTLASGNNLAELVMSGANGTSSITATALRISVTNTGTTGTNVGLTSTASGATNNYAAVFPAGRVGIGTATPSTGDLYITNASTATVTVINSGFNASAGITIQAVSGKPLDLRYITARTQMEWINGGSATIWTMNYDSHNQGFDMSSTAPTAKIHIGAQAAGASTAPLKLTTSATLQTTAEAGAFEYSTPQLFFTNGAAVRQELFQGQQARVSTQYDNTTTTLGNVTGLTANVAAGKTYRFEARLYTTSNVGGGVKIAIAGTATATAIIYEGLTADAGLFTQGRGAALGTAVAGVTAVTAAFCTISGTITVNAAGTLTVQAAANAAVGTTSVLVGSTFHLIEML